MARPVGKRSALMNRGPEAICIVTSLQSNGSYKKLQCGQKYSMENFYNLQGLHALWFVTEVAPPRFISVIRRPMKKLLATIHEEESEIISRSLSVSLANSSTDLEKKL
ncbi:hypothetical protein POM88_052250 [Heracleum sosnowskyi]|uniref:Uncharacterized protein n=1 Tax=Heracleum sosnowskyi TaxID=360622 RepID=A0AAD8GRK8_9APIA|nr:hypothetical protein POM88_052250 [Heracleum sosnowskyi]